MRKIKSMFARFFIFIERDLYGIVLFSKYLSNYVKHLNSNLF